MTFEGHAPTPRLRKQKERAVARLGEGVPSSGQWPKYVTDLGKAIVRDLSSAVLGELGHGDGTLVGRIYMVEVQGPGRLQYVKAGRCGGSLKPAMVMGWQERFHQHEKMAKLHDCFVVDGWISSMLENPELGEAAMLAALKQLPGVVLHQREYFRGLSLAQALEAVQDNAVIEMGRIRTSR